MNMAAEFYGTAWDVEDVHGIESYDLICRRGNEVNTSKSRGLRQTAARSSSPLTR